MTTMFVALFLLSWTIHATQTSDRLFFAENNNHPSLPSGQLFAFQGKTALPISPEYLYLNIRDVLSHPITHDLFVLVERLPPSKKPSLEISTFDFNMGTLKSGWSVLDESGLPVDFFGCSFHPDGSLWAWAPKYGVITIDILTHRIRSHLPTSSFPSLDSLHTRLVWDHSGSNLFAFDGKDLISWSLPSPFPSVACKQPFHHPSLSLGNQKSSSTLSAAFSLIPSSSSTRFLVSVKSPNGAVHFLDFSVEHCSAHPSPLVLSSKPSLSRPPLFTFSRQGLEEYPGFVEHFPSSRPQTQAAVELDQMNTEAQDKPFLGAFVGDPVVITLDNLTFPMQAVGEFLLARDNDIQVQVRTCAFPVALNSNPTLSVHCGIAINYRGGLLDFSLRRQYRDDSPLAEVNGYTISLIPLLPLGNLGSVSALGRINSANGLTITTRFRVTRHNVTAQVFRSNITFEQFFGVFVDFPASSRGNVEGFLGNFNGNATDDMFTRSATRAGRRFFNPNSTTTRDLYEVYFESWRLTQEESRFTYGDGENTTTYTDRLFRGQTTGSLQSFELASARAQCAVRLIPSWLLDACASDVAISGDPSFINSFFDYRRLVTVAPPTPFRPYTTSAPSTPGRSNKTVFLAVGAGLLGCGVLMILHVMLILRKRERTLRERDGEVDDAMYQEEYEEEEEVLEEAELSQEEPVDAGETYEDNEKEREMKEM